MSAVPPGGWVAPETPAAPPAPPLPAAPARGPLRTLPSAPAPLRPLTTPDVLDGAFAVLKAAPTTLIAMAALLVVPLHALTTWLAADVLSEGFTFDLYTDSSSTATAGGASGDTASSFWIQLFGTSLAASILVVGAARVIVARRSGQDVTLRAVLLETLRCLPALLVAWTIGHLLEVVAVIGLFVGTLLPMTWFFVTAPVIAMERVGPFAALRRSARLTARRFWPTLGFLLLLWLVLSLFDEALGTVPSVVALLPGGERFLWIPVAATGMISGALLVPVAAAAATLWYLDLRVRTEGLDLELEAARAFPETPTA